MADRLMQTVMQVAGLVLIGTLHSAPAVAGLSAEQINNATPSFDATPAAERQTPDPLIIKTQILLDRAGTSPGVIDGYDGDNYRKALRAFEEINDFPVDGVLDSQVWQLLNGAFPSPVIKQYTIAPSDTAMPLSPAIPVDYSEKAQLERLGYTSMRELFAERFHMDEDLLDWLNAGVDLSSPGTVLIATDTTSPTPQAAVSRLTVDATAGLVRAFDDTGQMVAAYPATIGSSENPSPEGRHEVTGVALDPTYTYNPEKNFQQGDNDQVLTLPPGPNGPVGSVWIDLSKPTYGIHGTPEPAKIAKTNSHGCVRLTNWDAAELAEMVSPGTIVEFVR